jgi:HSP20 family molecular chaperone IbpA
LKKLEKNKRTMTLIKFNKNANRSFAPVFPSIFNDMMEDLRLNNGGTALPAVNISETESGFHLELSIPGFSKEEISISLDENNLIVSGEKNTFVVSQCLLAGGCFFAKIRHRSLRSR